LLIDHVDEAHGFRIEAKQANPLFEVEMLLFYLFDKSRKNILHFFLKHKKLRNLGVWILANDVFQLRPFHFFTFLMEQGALAFC